jgi:hypothetical protein
MNSSKKMSFPTSSEPRHTYTGKVINTAESNDLFTINHAPMIYQLTSLSNGPDYTTLDDKLHIYLVERLLPWNAQWIETYRQQQLFNKNTDLLVYVKRGIKKQKDERRNKQNLLMVDRDITIQLKHKQTNQICTVIVTDVGNADGHGSYAARGVVYAVLRVVKTI